MTVLNAHLMTHDAVYWGSPTKNVTGGTVFAPARKLKVFWVDTVELFRDAQGEDRVSQSQVFVQEELEDGGFLHRGLLSGLTDEQKAHPSGVAKAYEIRKLDHYTGFSGLETHVAWL